MCAALLALVLRLAMHLACGSNEASVRMVESLPKQRIEKLAADMMALADTSRTGRSYFDERTGIPPEFADLKPRSITVRGPDVAIHLSGCFDDKAMIFLVDTGERQRMDLRPGEAKEKKELWRSDRVAP